MEFKFVVVFCSAQVVHYIHFSVGIIGSKQMLWDNREWRITEKGDGSRARYLITEFRSDGFDSGYSDGRGGPEWRIIEN